MTRDELIEIMARALSGPDAIVIDIYGARDALAAIEAAGLAIVPVEATVGMICDGIDSAMSASIQEEYTWPYYVADIYDSMIEAGRI